MWGSPSTPPPSAHPPSAHQPTDLPTEPPTHPPTHPPTYPPTCHEEEHTSALTILTLRFQTLSGAQGLREGRLLIMQVMIRILIVTLGLSIASGNKTQCGVTTEPTASLRLTGQDVLEICIVFVLLYRNMTRHSEGWNIHVYIYITQQ